MDFCWSIDTDKKRQGAQGRRSMHTVPSASYLGDWPAQLGTSPANWATTNSTCGGSRTRRCHFPNCKSIAHKKGTVGGVQGHARARVCILFVHDGARFIGDFVKKSGVARFDAHQRSSLALIWLPDIRLAMDLPGLRVASH
ncbi:hypothetical protein TW95_gp1315 [Pandoravirus inopinatum]|uniref:Uncharacterized protein n=1 Tax=Pandoravirus inopinatum TaxID=1605721 RepID=A0A0B5J374_9VIRU|nr:hypothetical protein TW95_gp1315 [Pandoravirus inopinatum]AJF98049.1 hypothetical protein [Pandoravirus inopinatum]